MKKGTILIVLILLFSFSTTVNAFSDVSSNDWFYSNVTKLKNKGIVNGYNDNTFKPHNNVTHGEALKMLVGLRGLKPSPNPESTIRHSNAVKYNHHWAEGYVQTAIEEDILYLNKEGLNYDKKASRYEVANYIINYINASLSDDIVKYDVKPGYSKDSYFMDAYGSTMDFLYNMNIIKGNPGKNGYYFEGNRNITRAEFTAIMDRVEAFIDKYNNGEEIITEKRDEINPVVNSYEMIKNVRTLNYSIDPYLMNNFNISDMSKAMYYMKYNGMESLDFRYTKENVGKVIIGNKVDTEYIETVRSAYRYCSAVYPELFFSENRISIAPKLNPDGSLNVKISVVSPYLSFEELASMRNEFYSKTLEEAKKLIDNGTIKQGMSQYQIAMAVNNWIAKNTTYDSSDDRLNNGHGAIVNKVTACSGYTSLLNRMLSLYGIEAYGSSGLAYDTNELHVWTEAILDGEKYYIDTTWNSVLGKNNYFTKDKSIFTSTRSIDEFIGKY